MKKIYFFESTRKTDKCSLITVLASNEERALACVRVSFKVNGYKGKPQKLAV